MAARALFAGAAGAAGYTAYQSHPEVGDISRSVWGLLTKQGSPNQLEVDRLKDQLDGLQRLLIRSQERQAVTIVHTNQRSGWGYILYPTAIAGTAVLYMRYVKGWKLSDFMYVTRSSLAQMKNSMAETMGKMQEQLRLAQDELNKRLGRVSAQQAELREAQASTDGKVAAVATDVRNVAASVDEVHQDVRGLHEGMDRATLGIEAANRSIYLLCGAVVEVAKKVGLNGQHTSALDHMVSAGGVLPAGQQQQALQGAAERRQLLAGPQGLQMVIEDIDDAGSSSSGGGGRGLPQRLQSGRATAMEEATQAAAGAFAAAAGSQVRARSAASPQAHRAASHDFYSSSALRTAQRTPT